LTTEPEEASASIPSGDHGRRWQRIDQLFDRALDVPEAERDAFLTANCAGDAELRGAVERLLAADAGNERFLESPAPWGDRSGAEPSPAGDSGDLHATEVAASIGPYRILSRIGQGGMGVVYLARREDDLFAQRVAVKFLLRGLDGPHEVARFERERQALAQLAHPSIARLLDGGATADGRPYLIMEYVEGVALDEACDRRGAPVTERLERFLDVCGAVEHAHAHLLVHRDLKPGNVLVNEAGEVKLLDFGLVKRLRPEAAKTATPLHDLDTVTELRPVTLGYSAPEQMRGGAITTATDVYSLGVLLHQLLVGVLPFDDDRILAAAYAGAPWPVAASLVHRLSRRTPLEREAVARWRSTPLTRLSTQLGGDLDAILGKALEERPERRYSSVRALADDVRRHLDHRPVAARRPTRGYRLRRFVRRHRWAVSTVAAGAALVALTVGLGIARARDVAREKETAEQALTFLEGLFAAAGTSWSGSQSEPPTLRSVLDLGAESLRTELAERPATRRRLARSLAGAYLDLGLGSPAEELVREVLTDAAKTSASLAADEAGEFELLRVRALSAQGRFRPAAELATSLLAARPDASADAPAGATATRRSRLLQALASAQVGASEFADAERNFSVAVDEARRAGPLGGEVLTRALDGLAGVYRRTGRLEEALALRRELLDQARRLHGEGHLATLLATMNLATAEAGRGDTDAAASHMRLVLEGLAGRDQPLLIAEVHSSLAAVAIDQGDAATARPHARESLRLRTAALGPDHPLVANSFDTVGAAARDLGDLVEAEEAYRSSLRIREAAFGERHAQVARSLCLVAELALRRGRLGEANALFERGLRVSRDVLGPEHVQVSRALSGLGRVAQAEGRLGDAERWLRESLRLRVRGLPPEHHWTAEAKSELGGCLVMRGATAEAAGLLRDALDVLRRANPADLRVAETETRLRALADRTRRSGAGGSRR
jgi:serine/threonine protein kinase/tetratricopeptide (TPR) repeat protein